MIDDTPRGLLALDDHPIPLEGVRIDARLDGPGVEVTLTHRYRNAETVPVEAVYVFPLEEGAAVCGFAARIDDQLVEGRVEERHKAFEVYDDAMADGNGAFLLDQERPNVFTASVGNLKPGAQVDVELKYVALARYDGDAMRLAIPTTVSPRYVPAAPPEVGEPDGDRVNPERRFHVPYGLTLRVDVEMTGALRSVESPSHAVRTTLRDGGALVELSQEQAALDRDFVLLVEAEGARQPRALVVREEDGTRVCMVDFLPDLSDVSEPANEVLFLLDCSGSMGGDSIHQARQALELCVRALGTEDTFNITRFGSHHESLWPAPRALTDASLDEAVGWIRGSEASLGGTEILAPLTELVMGQSDPKRPRQILLLTDGQVSNEAQVIQLAKKHAERARVFSFGIGAGASEHLVHGVARASRGAAEMIFPGERIEPKVLRMFGRLRTPALTDVSVDWGGMEVEQAPAITPPVFAGDMLTVFARVRAGGAATVTLRAGQRRWELPLDLEQAPLGGPVPTLWARERIRDVESGSGRHGSAQRRARGDDKKHAELVELGKRYGLVSSVTSYVAVEVREEGDKTTEQAQLRKVPVALTAGWHGMGGLLNRGALTVWMHSMAPTAAGGWGDTARYKMASTHLRTAASAPAPGQRSKRKGRGFVDRFADLIVHRASPSRALFHEEAEAFDAMPAEEADWLYDLLMGQRADGSFRMSMTLETQLGAERLARVQHAIGAESEALVVTAVVVALLRRDLADRAGEWRAAVDKAERWLAKQGVSVDVDALLA